jgi:hypothetical protein
MRRQPADKRQLKTDEEDTEFPVSSSLVPKKSP